MAEPHVRYAPYATREDQAIVSLHDFALSAQRQDETQRGNNPQCLPPSQAIHLGIRMKRLKRRAKILWMKGEQRDFQVETSVELLISVSSVTRIASDSPISFCLQSDSTIALRKMLR
jgi:hypothetical protein